MGVVGVFQHQYPVAVENLAGPAHDVVVLEELRRDVLPGVGWFAFAHPDEDDSLEGDGLERPSLHLPHHGRVGAFGEESDAVAVAVEGCAVIGAGDGAVVEAVTQRQVGAAVGAGVFQGLDFAVESPEEHQVFAQHTQHLGLLLNILVRQGRVPVLLVAQGRNPAAHVVGVLGLLEGGRLPLGLTAAGIFLVAAGIAGPGPLQTIDNVPVHGASSANNQAPGCPGWPGMGPSLAPWYFAGKAGGFSPTLTIPKGGEGTCRL